MAAANATMVGLETSAIVQPMRAPVRHLIRANSVQDGVIAFVANAVAVNPTLDRTAKRWQVQNQNYAHFMRTVCVVQFIRNWVRGATISNTSAKLSWGCIARNFSKLWKVLS